MANNQTHTNTVAFYDLIWDGVQAFEEKVGKSYDEIVSEWGKPQKKGGVLGYIQSYDEFCALHPIFKDITRAALNSAISYKRSCAKKEVAEMNDEKRDPSNTTARREDPPDDTMPEPKGNYFNASTWSRQNSNETTLFNKETSLATSTMRGLNIDALTTEDASPFSNFSLQTGRKHDPSGDKDYYDGAPTADNFATSKDPSRSHAKRKSLAEDPEGTRCKSPRPAPGAKFNPRGMGGDRGDRGPRFRPTQGRGRHSNATEAGSSAVLKFGPAGVSHTDPLTDPTRMEFWEHCAGDWAHATLLNTSRFASRFDPKHTPLGSLRVLTDNFSDDGFRGLTSHHANSSGEVQDFDLLLASLKRGVQDELEGRSNRSSTRLAEQAMEQGKAVVDHLRKVALSYRNQNDYTAKMYDEKFLEGKAAADRKDHSTDYARAQFERVKLQYEEKKQQLKDAEKESAKARAYVATIEEEKKATTARNMRAINGLDTSADALSTDVKLLGNLMETHISDRRPENKGWEALSSKLRASELYGSASDIQQAIKNNGSESG